MKTIIGCLLNLTIGGVLFQASAAQTNILDMPGDANIFGAGRAVAPAPGGGGGGTLPPSVTFPAGLSNVFTFSATGLIASDGVTFWGPDGGPWPTSLSSYQGISGITSTDHALFLTCVFLTDAQATNPAPPILNFSPGALGVDFLALAPVIGQTFYIGDGTTSGAEVQRFLAPTNATRLFLGVGDAQGFSGLPGYYQDNGGSLSVTVIRDVDLPPPVLQLNLYAGIRIDGVVGARYFIEFTDSLTNGVWSPLTNIVLPITPYLFIDTSTPATATRFYRAVLVQ